MLPVRLTYESFCEWFNSDKVCADALFQARWPEGFRCPRCCHPAYYLIRTRRLPLYECRSCSRQTSVIAGTIMEGSSTSLPRWFQAMFLLSQPAGISATRLSDMMEVTYKTAWLIAHKIRYALQQADRSEPLTGAVRVDRIHYGCSEFLDARQPLVIGMSLDKRNKPRHVKIKQPEPIHVKNNTRMVMSSGVEAFVQEFAHKRNSIRLARHGVRHPASTQFKREVSQWLNDTFHGIGAKHLQTYLDEFCYRLNLKLRELSVFGRLFHWCANTRVLQYKDLTRSRPVLPVPWIIWGGKAKWRGRYLTLWNT